MCRDRGSMTIWAAALAGLVLLGSSAAVLYGSAVAGRHRAETAADLAALAAAVHVVDSPASACAIGARIAIGNGGSLRGCEVVGDKVEVVVSRRVSLGGLGTFTAVARARAGPVEPGGVRVTQGEGAGAVRADPLANGGQASGEPDSVGVGASRRGRSGRRRCVVADSSTGASL